MMITLPQVQESETVLRQLAIALDPGAATEAARLRQQYDVSLAIMVAGVVAMAYALTRGIRSFRYLGMTQRAGASKIKGKTGRWRTPEVP